MGNKLEIANSSTDLNRFIFRILSILCLSILSILVHRFCHQQTGGFSIAKIQSHHIPHTEWITPVPTEAENQQLQSLFDQKFTFFSYGGQAYVFLSEDGKSVLKLFKHHHMSSPRWLKKLPLPKSLNRIRNKFIYKNDEKLSVFFNSCKIAYDHLKDHTAMIYLHLTPTDHFHRQLTLIDKLGIAHQIDLDHTDFVLQNRATLTSDHFFYLKQHNDIISAKKSIDSLLELMVIRSQKGIADRDPNLRRNCGFIGNNAVEIDIGSYTFDASLKIPFIGKTDVYHKSLQLIRLIAKVYPELTPYLHQKLTETLGAYENPSS